MMHLKRFSVVADISGFSKLDITIMISLVLLALTIAGPNFEKASVNSKRMACEENINKIADAIKDLEKRTPAGQVVKGLDKKEFGYLNAVHVGNILLENGAFKELPVCPVSGEQYGFEIISPSKIAETPKVGLGAAKNASDKAGKNKDQKSVDSKEKKQASDAAQSAAGKNTDGGANSQEVTVTPAQWKIWCIGRHHGVDSMPRYYADNSQKK